MFTLKKLDRQMIAMGATLPKQPQPSAISQTVTLVKETRADHESGLADKLKSAISDKEALSAKLLPIEANAKKTVKDQIDAAFWRKGTWRRSSPPGMLGG